MLVNKQIFVSGSVQGVFFRESTRQVASELGLAGGVRNLSDGRVEVRVTGEEESVLSLIKWLKIGPKLAKVSNIEVIGGAVTGQVPDLPAVTPFNPSKGQFEIWPTI